MILDQTAKQSVTQRNILMLRNAFEKTDLFDEFLNEVRRIAPASIDERELWVV
jgi:hypothetical protein